MRKPFSTLISAVITVLVLASFFVLWARRSADTEPARETEGAASVQQTPAMATVPAPAAASATPAGSPVAFGLPKKAAHYESNTPAHGAVLAAPPVNVVIDVNFDLAPSSSISVMSGGREYGTGETVIDAGKLAMRRTVDPSAPDGRYTVTYRACWPDGSCHDGQFEFAIDRTRAGAARDLRGQAAVSVDLKDLAFAPPDIRISPGTSVTWTNRDTVAHYVNTDAHPSHTYYPPQNSQRLAPGDSFRLVFATPGAYPYHCGAHADAMRGTVIVEETS